MDFSQFKRLGVRHVRTLLSPTISSWQMFNGFSRQVLLQCLNFANVIASGLMLWKGLGIVTNTESPIVVVLRCVVAIINLPLGCSDDLINFFAQWFHGASFLPRGSVIPHKPCQRTIPYRRYHRL